MISAQQLESLNPQVQHLLQNLLAEHDAQLRLQVCQALQWLGVQIDPVRNLQACGDNILSIHAVGSMVEIWVVPTDEGRVAAREAAALLRGA